ncbi:putative transcriptional regulator [Pantoea phage vB_PagS_AAS23]|uniref:Putative transcriptional regulator n=1 Tax=Pantoea phage vB_PagS_AAS23 TaxID=2499073 RepID=A0A3S9U7Q3_9CAUD|nr:transcriptional regulator [Pantoea phage vB_PagS_AAS23]AZS06344.1 putative transcriptional regulator [Pantoea phage vB_PagS_AAS23]
MSERIAVSTGEPDKRPKNGNNGTRRGPDKRPRKRCIGYDILKDEVKASLANRLQTVLAYYGTKAEMGRRLKVSKQTINAWIMRGRISTEGARRVHRDYIRNGFSGYRASFCRPDLRFDANGKAVSQRCNRKDMVK